MSSSVDFSMMVRLESQMLNQVYNNLQASSSESNTLSGPSFSDLLNSEIAGDSVEQTNTANPFDTYGVSAPSGIYSSSPAVPAGGMSISDDMVKFIERHEGFAADGYRGVDNWNVTIGYGHVIEPGESFGTLTPESAETLLRNDLSSCEASVNKEFAGCNLTQGQFDALTSFAMGLGTNIWSRTPKLVSDIKSAAPDSVIEADFVNCSKCGGQVVQGLVNRREAEYQVFANGNYNA